MNAHLAGNVISQLKIPWFNIISQSWPQQFFTRHSTVTKANIMLRCVQGHKLFPLNYSPGPHATHNPTLIGWNASSVRHLTDESDTLVPLTNSVNALHSLSLQALPRLEDLFPWQPEGNFSQNDYCAMHHDISPTFQRKCNNAKSPAVPAVFLFF